MAIRDPLVLIDGKIKELPVGDTIVNGNTFAMTAAEDITAMRLVYVSGTDEVKMCNNSSENTMSAVGMSVNAISNGDNGTITAFGLITTSGLVAGEIYYVGANGELIDSSNLPTATGSVIQKVGRALSTTKLLLDIDESITIN